MKSLIQNKPPLNSIAAGNISVSLTEMSIIRVKLLLLQQQIFLKINAMKTPSPEYNFVLWSQNPLLFTHKSRALFTEYQLTWLISQGTLSLPLQVQSNICSQAVALNGHITEIYQDNHIQSQILMLMANESPMFMHQQEASNIWTGVA